MVALIQALMALYPDKEWTVDGDSYRGIRWGAMNMKESERPTEEFIELKRQELIDAQKWGKLREERNKRLSQCDWVTLKAYSTGVPVSDEWKAYMQALRDLPANTEDPTSPTWPQEPTD
jgi:hypothetical protein